MKYDCPMREVECMSCKEKMMQKDLGRGRYDDKEKRILYTGHMAVCKKVSLVCDFLPHAKAIGPAKKWQRTWKFTSSSTVGCSMQV